MLNLGEEKLKWRDERRTFNVQHRMLNLGGYIKDDRPTLNAKH